MSMRILVLFFMVVLAGCGYHTPGASDSWVGGDERIVYVELFDNLTAEPYLENFMTDALVAELSRSRVVTLTENPGLAGVRVSGEVKDFTSTAIAFGASDQITNYQASMTVVVRLVRTANNEVLWQGTLQRSEDFLATVSKSLRLEGERLAASQAARRLAEDIHASLLQDF